MKRFNDTIRTICEEINFNIEEMEEQVKSNNTDWSDEKVYEEETEEFLFKNLDKVDFQFLSSRKNISEQNLYKELNYLLSHYNKGKTNTKINEFTVDLDICLRNIIENNKFSSETFINVMKILYKNEQHTNLLNSLFPFYLATTQDIPDAYLDYCREHNMTNGESKKRMQCDYYMIYASSFIENQQRPDDYYINTDYFDISKFRDIISTNASFSIDGLKKYIEKLREIAKNSGSEYMLGYFVSIIARNRNLSPEVREFQKNYRIK